MDFNNSKDVNRQQRIRRARYEALKDALRFAEQRGKEIIYNKMLCVLMDQELLTRRTAKEYIDALVGTGFAQISLNEKGVKIIKKLPDTISKDWTVEDMFIKDDTNDIKNFEVEGIEQSMKDIKDLQEVIDGESKL
jgi:hypothetical protein